MSTSTPRRPALRYHGGKWRLAPWIIGHFPPHRIYVEPFGGAASVLLRKPRSYAEVYNDIDDEIVNVFTVLRHDSDRLLRALALTPFSRTEFDLAHIPSQDPLERARRTLIKSGMGFGSTSTVSRHKTGFRHRAFICRQSPATDWYGVPGALGAVVERLQGVVIENRDALTVILEHDSPDTLFYVDPPYVQSTRTATRDSRECYRFELSDEDHETLATTLHALRGMVIIGGYSNAIYDEHFRGWEHHTRSARADGAKPRTEHLWLNPAAATRRKKQLHFSRLHLSVEA